MASDRQRFEAFFMSPALKWRRLAWAGPLPGGGALRSALFHRRSARPIRRARRDCGLLHLHRSPEPHPEDDDADDSWFESRFSTPPPLFLGHAVSVRIRSYRAARDRAQRPARGIPRRFGPFGADSHRNSLRAGHILEELDKDWNSLGLLLLLIYRGLADLVRQEIPFLGRRFHWIQNSPWRCAPHWFAHGCRRLLPTLPWFPASNPRTW